MNLKQAWNYVFYQNSRSKASAGQGTLSVGEVIFNIFTFSTASPSGTYSTIPANWWMWPSTDQSIFPFSSRRLPSWIISSMTWYSQSWVCEFNWIFFLIHVWNELIDFCDFFIMFPCRDLSVPLPPPQFIPFPPALTMSSSHWILLFIHIWWWDRTTYKHGHNKLIF